MYVSDWLCVRHDRDTAFPICETENWLSKHITPTRHPFNSTYHQDNGTSFYENTTAIFEETNPILSETIDANKNETSSEADGSVQIAVKSRTLPEYSCKYAFIKHKRSISESKTMDGIILSANTGSVSRTRFNSGTDSNTSGVSSYESVFGMVATDLCKTLSPIPSSSNLVEMKRVPSERLRRTSLTGSRCRDVLISPQDAQGYEKLRLIRGHRRPQLSESAVDESIELLNSTAQFASRLSLEQVNRRLKVRSLDRRSNYDTIAPSEPLDMSRVSDNTPYYTPNINIGSSQCYSGICLPKNIQDLFPNSKSNGTYVTRCTKDPDSVDMVLKHGAVADFISECDEYSVSSLSDISSTTSKRSKIAGSRHNRTTCVLCCRTPHNSTQLNPNTLSSSDLIGSDLQASNDNLNDKSIETVNTETTCSSSENHLLDDSSCEKIQGMILKHVQRMANPVWSKQSKLALSKIKQKHPQFFRSACLYSDICISLGQNTYRFSSRRFLQEIFGEVDYSVFYSDAHQILNRKKEYLLSNIECSQQSTKYETGNVVGDTDPSPAPISILEGIPNQNANLSSVPFPIRPHLAKSPLASVHETSKENLTDGSGGQSKLNSNNVSIKNNQCKDTEDIRLNISDNSNDNSNDNSISDSIQNDNRSYTFSRPRFNTLASGFSFRINKFPIGNRYDLASTNKSDYPQRITKSLSASIASAPSMSLYCEKRLQNSKSEALLMKSTEIRRNSINLGYRLSDLQPGNNFVKK